MLEQPYIKIGDMVTLQPLTTTIKEAVKNPKFKKYVAIHTFCKNNDRPKLLKKSKKMINNKKKQQQ